MSKIKNIIFDWDNTLFPFKKYWDIAHRRLFEDVVAQDNVDADTFMEKYKYFDELYFPKVLSHEWTIERMREERLRSTLKHFDMSYTEEFIQYFFDDFLVELLEAVSPNIELRARLEGLSKQYQFAILSNGESKEQRDKIKAYGFEGLCPVYISRETGFTKPDERAFINVLEKENYQAEETLMIGDLYDHDIEPAQKLGLQTAYINKEKGRRADFEFNDIEEVLEFLEK